MLNWIWLSFLVVAVLVGGFTGKLPAMTKGAFEAAEGAVMGVALPLLGIWAIWLGIMRLAERSGLVQMLAHALRPLMRKLFPEVPPEHPAMGAMIMNMAANMLGLGNAATPLGLRAMAHLERLNPHPGVATNAMCTFLALNTASIQVIPTTAIGILAVAGSVNPAAIIPAAFLATLCSASAGVIAAKLLERLPMFRPRPALLAASERDRKLDAPEETETEVEKVQVKELSGVAKGALILFLLAFGCMFLMLCAPELINSLLSGLQSVFTSGVIPPDAVWQAPAPPGDLQGKSFGIRVLYSLAILAVPFLLSFFPLYAAVRGVPVYEQFVEGAKEAFGTAQRVIPYLVAMLVSIRLLRDAGVLDAIARAFGDGLARVGFPVDLLPLVLMRPLSGSAANGIFVELVTRLGADTLASKMAATIYGSTETTFYVLAVYFGAVAIRQTRHAVAAGLIADAVAVIAAVAICRLMFT